MKGYLASTRKMLSNIFSISLVLWIRDKWYKRSDLFVPDMVYLWMVLLISSSATGEVVNLTKMLLNNLNP